MLVELVRDNNGQQLGMTEEVLARLLALLVGLRVLDSEGCRSALAVQCRALLDQRPLLGPELLKLFRGRWYPQLANLALLRFELLNNNCMR